MKKAMKIMTIISAGIAGIMISIGGTYAIVSAFRCVNAFIDNRTPETIEWIGLVAIALMGCLFGAIMCAIDIKYD